MLAVVSTLKLLFPSLCSSHVTQLPHSLFCLSHILISLFVWQINLVETFVTGSEAGKIRATAPVTASSPAAPLYGNLAMPGYGYGYSNGYGGAEPFPAAAAAVAGAAAAALAQLGASLPLPRLLRPVGLASSSVGSTLPAVADFRLAVATLPTATATTAVDGASAAVATWRQAPVPVPGLVDVEQLPSSAEDDGGALLLLLASHYGGLGRWGGASSSASISAAGGVAASAAVAPAAGAAASGSSAGAAPSQGRNTLHIWSAAAGKEVASVSLDAFIDSRAQGPIRSITLMPASASLSAGAGAGEDASTCVDLVGEVAAAAVSPSTRVFRVLVATDAALTTVQLTLTLPVQSADASAAPRASLAATPLASFSVPLDIAAPLPSGVVVPQQQLRFGTVAAAAAPVVGDIALSSSSSASSKTEAATAPQLDRAHVLFPAEGVVRTFRLPCWEPLAVARLPAPAASAADSSAASASAGAGSGATVWRGMTAAAGADGRSLLLSAASGAALHEVTLPAEQQL